nr:MAG TPA: BM2 protein [Caudoviricetes sp.]
MVAKIALERLPYQILTLSVFILSQHQGSPYQRTSSRNLSLP